ncbi:MAG: DMT family transporter [bacterium]
MSQRARAELWLFSVTIIWGSTFVVTKILLQSLSPFVYISSRFALAAIIFFAVYHKEFLTFHQREVRYGIILGALLFTGFMLQTIGLMYTTASKSAFITGLMVVFTPLFQLALERRAPKLGNIFGIIIVIAGLYLLTSPAGSSFNRGDALTIFGAMLFGLYIVLIDMFTKVESPSKLTFIQFVSCALFGGIGVLFFEKPVFVSGPSVWLSLIYLAIFATVIAIYIQARFQRYTSPTRSVVIFSIEPVLAALFAYAILGEVLGMTGIMGGGLILIGLLVSELTPADKE